MSRYIDADALLSKGQFVVRMNDYGEYFVTVEEINKMPTIDAVPVTRCGRCEYYSNEMNCCSYVNGLQNVTKTDYCSYGRCAEGERRTE